MIEIAGDLLFDDSDRNATLQDLRAFGRGKRGETSRRYARRAYLTDEMIKALPPCDTWLRDTGNPDLAVRLRRTGGKSFYLLLDFEEPSHLCKEGQSERKEFIGNTLDYTVEEARKKAEWIKADFIVDRPLSRLRRDIRIDAAVAKYLDECRSPEGSWHKTKTNLLTQYVIGRYGQETLSAVRKDRWLLLIDKVAAEHRSRGAHLQKALKSFFRWSVCRGILDANPLAFEKFNLPPLRNSVYLGIESLAAIYDAAECETEPFATMLRLMILSGEGMEYVRKMQQDNIDLDRAIWVVAWDESGCNPKRTMHLSSKMLELLTPFCKKRDTSFRLQGFQNLGPSANQNLDRSISTQRSSTASTKRHRI